MTLSDGTNTFTATASDSYGRTDTNTVTAYFPATASFAYDAKGNLTSDGRRGFEYDDANQLVSITATNSWQTKIAYDGLKRRRVRTELSWNGSAFVTNGVVRYVYDGLVIVQGRDGNNTPLVTYTRGLDLSGTRQGAGGIGGLLGRTDNTRLAAGLAGVHAYYHSDAGGNITAMVNDKQAIVARYQYDPFGNPLSMSGPLAPLNNIRAHSQEHHDPSGLDLYVFRSYEANLQRFLNQDPIGEAGGINLYAFVGNDPISGVDPLGLDWTEWIPNWIGRLFGDYTGPTYLSANGKLYANPPSIEPDFTQMGMARADVGGYDPSGLQAAASALRAAVDMTPVGIFNDGYTACKGKDAITLEPVSTADRVQAAAQVAAAILPAGLSAKAACGEFNTLAKGIQAAGRFDAKVGSLDEARRLIRAAMPDAVELPAAVAGQPYPKAPPGVKQWFQVQPAEPGVGNDLPHIKYVDWTGGKKRGGGSWGHIFFPP